MTIFFGIIGGIVIIALSVGVGYLLASMNFKAELEASREMTRRLLADMGAQQQQRVTEVRDASATLATEDRLGELLEQHAPDPSVPRIPRK